MPRIALEPKVLQHFSIWFDKPKLGCGWRSYLLLKEGHKYVTLICTENGKSLRLKIKEWEATQRKLLELNKEMLISRLTKFNTKKEHSNLTLAIKLLQE